MENKLVAIARDNTTGFVREVMVTANMITVGDKQMAAQMLKDKIAIDGDLDPTQCMHFCNWCAVMDGDTIDGVTAGIRKIKR